MNIKQLIEQNKVQYDLTNKDKTKILNIRDGLYKVFDDKTNTWVKYNLDDLEKLNFELFIQILFDDWEVI
jgi:hypothetical protein